MLDMRRAQEKAVGLGKGKSVRDEQCSLLVDDIGAAGSDEGTASGDPPVGRIPIGKFGSRRTMFTVRL